MDKFAVHYSPDDEAMEELLSRTPFNLKKDLNVPFAAKGVTHLRLTYCTENHSARQ